MSRAKFAGMSLLFVGFTACDLGDDDTGDTPDDTGVAVGLDLDGDGYTVDGGDCDDVLVF